MSKKGGKSTDELPMFLQKAMWQAQAAVMNADADHKPHTPQGCQ